MHDRKRTIAVILAIIIIFLAAWFIGIDHKIEITKEGEGSVSPSGDVVTNHLGSVSITIEPSEGWEIESIFVDGKYIDISHEIVLKRIVKDHSVHVIFVEEEPPAVYHEITVTSSAGGVIEPSGTFTILHGEPLEFSIKANPGYSISSISVNGELFKIEDGIVRISSVTSDLHVIADFIKQGGGTSPGPDRPYITGIGVDNAPERCFAGESLDTSGMAVYAIYSNGSKKIVTGFSLDQTIWDSPGEKNVTVTYLGFHSYFDVVVPELASIHIASPITTYQLGESPDRSDFTVTASYSDGSTRVVTDYTISPETLDGAGIQEINISYSEGSMTVIEKFTITVIDTSGMEVRVLRYRGIANPDGIIRGFDYSYENGIPFNGFEFDMRGMVPGMYQTVTIEIHNGTGQGIDAYLFLDSIQGDEELANQILVTFLDEESSVSGIGQGEYLELCSLEDSQSATMELTISLPNLPGDANNAVQGKDLKFTLGIFGQQKGDSP